MGYLSMSPPHFCFCWFRIGDQQFPFIGIDMSVRFPSPPIRSACAYIERQALQNISNIHHGKHLLLEDTDQHTSDVAEEEEDEDCVGRSWGGDDEPKLFRLSYQAILKNCDNMLPEWDYSVQPMNILWECNGCENKLERDLYFGTQDFAYTGENWQLMDNCPNCCRVILVRADDSYNQPCTVRSVPYYGIMMSYWVVGATPIRLLNPPHIFVVTVVVDGVPHVLRIEPGSWHVSQTYNFLNLTEDRRPEVKSFTLEFYDEKGWDKEVQELAALEHLAVEESDVEASADDHESGKEDEEGKSESGSDND